MTQPNCQYLQIRQKRVESRIIQPDRSPPPSVDLSIGYCIHADVQDDPFHGRTRLGLATPDKLPPCQGLVEKCVLPPGRRPHPSSEP